MTTIFLIVFGGYFAVCVFAWARQRAFAYRPTHDVAGSPDDVGLAFEDVTFPSANGRTLHGWMVCTPGARYTLLYCHGNAGNITHRVTSVRDFAARELSVFIFDYAGFGKSSGRPGEKATYNDALGAWDYLVSERGVPPDRIILFGRSLGTAVAIDLATRVDAAAIILESAFTSAPEVGARAYPWLPVKLISRYHYDSLKKVSQLRLPKLYVHSINDRTVPYGMGRRLFGRSREPKHWIKVRGAHDANYLIPGSEYDRELRAFVADLEGPAREIPRLV